MTLRVAIAGSSGQLGRELVTAFGMAGNEVLALSRPEFDLASAVDLARIARLEPDVVVNCAAWTDVDGCARDPEHAKSVNGRMAGAIAGVAADVGALSVQISTNEVFDGKLVRPYVEDDEPRPPNAYGASKLLGERLVTAANPRHLIVRTAWIYGGPSSFPAKILAAAERAQMTGTALRVVADEFGNPTPADQLAQRIVEVVRQPDPPAILHLAGEPATSRYDWALSLVAPRMASGLIIQPIASVDWQRDSTPPRRSVLDMGRARGLGLEPIVWSARTFESDPP